MSELDIATDAPGVMTTAELAKTRQLIYTEFLCPVDEHAWARVYSGQIVLFVICRKCGRTPLEMLTQLNLKETPE